MLNDYKTQVKLTLFATIFLSTIQYFASDKIYVKEATFPLSKWPSSEPPMRFAILSDLHIGKFKNCTSLKLD